MSMVRLVIADVTPPSVILKSSFFTLRTVKAPKGSRVTDNRTSVQELSCIWQPQDQYMCCTGY
jgi:hypothetical protein